MLRVLLCVYVAVRLRSIRSVDSSINCHADIIVHLIITTSDMAVAIYSRIIITMAMNMHTTIMVDPIVTNIITIPIMITPTISKTMNNMISVHSLRNTSTQRYCMCSPYY